MRHQFARLPMWTVERRGALTYVERGGELVTRHPFDLTDARLFGFVVRADQDRLEEVCERSFGGPSGNAEQLVPVGSHVMLIFTEILDIRSSEPPDNSLGVVGEREAGVWVPILDRRRNRAAWTLPYLFVDEPAPMVGGREIYGFPKQLGNVTLPGEGEGPAAFAVRAPCIAHFEPNARMKTQPVLRVERIDGPASKPASEDPDPDAPLVPSERSNRQRTEPGWQWKTPADGLPAMRAHGRRARVDLQDASGGPSGFAEAAARLARNELAGWTDAARAGALLLSHLAFGRVPVILLKQFRDVADPRRACYQAIVEAEQDIVRFSGGGLLAGRWHVAVEELDGEPLRRELGIRPTVADLAFQLRLTFRIRAGRTLWEGR